MTPAELAAYFRVDPKTVTRWAKAGRFADDEVICTPGGHHRFRRSAIFRLEAEALLAARARDNRRDLVDEVAF